MITRNTKNKNRMTQFGFSLKILRYIPIYENKNKRF